MVKERSLRLKLSQWSIYEGWGDGPIPGPKSPLIDGIFGTLFVA